MRFVHLLAAAATTTTTGVAFAGVGDLSAPTVDSAPARCTPARVGQQLTRVFAAAARADAAGIRRTLAPTARFEWYSLTTVSGEQRLGHVVRRRPRTAARLLAERSREAGERILVVAVEVSYEKRRNIAHFGQLFRYRARDLAGGRWRSGHGKGAMDCASGGLMVWSAVAEVGPRAQGGQHRFCGRTAKSLMRRRAVTACGRP